MLALGLGGALSCSLPTNENPPPTKAPETGLGESTKCLNQVPDALKGFVEGNGNAEALNQAWNCLDDVIRDFEKNTVGSAQEHYTGRELANFFERYFLDEDQKISDALIEEVFHVKYALLGGSRKVVTRREILQLRSILPHFRDSMVKLSPHVKVYRLQWKPEKANHPSFQTAMDELARVAALLGSDFKNDYDLRRLTPLFQELKKLYKKTDKLDSIVQLAEKYSPVLAELRATIHTKLGWKVFFTTGSKIYSEYAYHHYYMKDLKLTEGEGLERLDGLVERSADILNEFITQKNKGVSALKPELSLDEINQILPALMATEVLPKKITQQSWRDLAKIIVNRVLSDPAKRIGGTPVDAINAYSIRTLRDEFKLWSQNQKLLMKIYENRAAGVSGAEILEFLRRPEIAEIGEGIQELVLIFDGPQALSTDEHGRIYLGEPDLPYSQKNSFLINIVRSGVRMITQGCANDLDRILKYGGVTEAEIHTCFLEVREFLGEMGLVDPKNLDFAKNRFRDGSLFTNWSNGDAYLDFKEGSNLILMILSGIEADSFFYNSLEKACPITKPTDVRYDWTVDLTCTIEVYKPIAKGYLQSMPDMVGFLDKLTPEEYHDVLINFIKGAGVIVAPDNSIKISDLALFPHIVQYTENVYQLYDQNRDGMFDTAEAMKAFPTFQAILKSATGGAFTTERQLKGLFAWMLVYGAPPKKEEVGKFLLIWLPKGEAGWNVQADRKKLSNILGILATPPPVAAQTR